LTIPVDKEFRDAVRRLHQAKEAAYRDAWKKRGEVMSIMANIARKVDRLENVASGATPTSDESLLDTSVDLFVYSLKYQTYLADQDQAVEGMLFRGSGAVQPYSDGLSAFEVLLARHGMTQLSQQGGPQTDQSTREVLEAFANLEACFQGTSATAPRRAAIAADLANAAVGLVGSLIREAPERYRNFLFTDGKETR
jgi:hypothetical protein